MLEKDVETQIKRWLHAKKIYYFKVHGSSFMQPGIPDIVACVDGRFVGIEVKNKGKLKNQSEHQKIHEQLIKESGGLFILADSLQTVKDILCQNTNTFYS